jgi:hypothetical protein
MTETRPTIVTGGQIAGIVPRDFDQCQRIAAMCVRAGMFQNGKKSKDEDAEKEAIAQASMAIMQGMELGIPPMQAVQNIAVINGRCTVWGDLIPALIWAHGHQMREWMEGDGDNRVAWCEITRADGFTDKRSFSVDDAKKAGLWDTREKVRRKGRNDSWCDAANDSPWFKYPNRMLQMRARGFAARDITPDALRGIYIREELAEEHREPRDVTPEPPRPPKAVEPPPPPPAPEEEPEQEGDAMTSDELLEHIDACLAVATDIETLDETWEDRMEAVGSDMDEPTGAKARELYDKHCERINRAAEEPDLPLEQAIAEAG